jgi:hypothetical protein
MANTYQIAFPKKKKAELAVFNNGTTLENRSYICFMPFATTNPEGVLKIIMGSQRQSSSIELPADTLWMAAAIAKRHTIY